MNDLNYEGNILSLQHMFADGSRLHRQEGCRSLCHQRQREETQPVKRAGT